VAVMTGREMIFMMRVVNFFLSFFLSFVVVVVVVYYENNNNWVDDDDDFLNYFDKIPLKKMQSDWLFFIVRSCTTSKLNQNYDREI
jgi:ABC-type dipeptide/oligopeptide/nickel transport system permease subunit